MEFSDAIALAGVAAGVLAFVTGLFQYRKAQRWKRLEFVANEVKAAFADPPVQRALQFLDWNLSTYDLRYHSDESALREVWIGDLQLERALVPHPQRPEGFSTIEVRVRASFDAFFEVLRRFEHFIQVGLVHPSDFHPYLRYWLERLCVPSPHGKSAPVLHAVWSYIEFYRYEEVLRLAKRYGYDCSSSRLAPTTPESPHPLPPSGA